MIFSNVYWYAVFDAVREHRAVNFIFSFFVLYMYSDAPYSHASGNLRNASGL